MEVTPVSAKGERMSTHPLVGSGFRTKNRWSQHLCLLLYEAPPRREPGTSKGFYRMDHEGTSLSSVKMMIGHACLKFYILVAAGDFPF